MNVKRIQVNAIPGLSAYRLSHLVSRLPLFAKPDRRGRLRKMGSKAALLRAMADRYPNVWAGIEDYAGKAHISERQAQEMLRELEFEDRLVVDITAGPERYQGHALRYRIPGAAPSFGGKKLGGAHGGNTASAATSQYFILDRKIVDIFIQWALFTPDGEPSGPKQEDKAEARRLMSDPARASTGEPGESHRVSPETHRVSPETHRVSPERASGAPCAPKPVIEPVIEPGKGKCVKQHPTPAHCAVAAKTPHTNASDENHGQEDPYLKKDSKPALDTLSARLFEFGPAFSGSALQALAALLRENTADDIVAAYRDFVRDMDEYNLQRAPWQFADAGRSMLLAVKLKREKEAQDERDRQFSMAEGLRLQEKLDAEAKAERDKKHIDDLINNF